jgi:hypothetical protein
MNQYIDHALDEKGDLKCNDDASVYTVGYSLKKSVKIKMSKDNVTKKRRQDQT